jgi:succinate-acetate transporter protein
MVPDQDIPIVEAMRVFGGGFVQALAAAAARADENNYAKLKTAFPEVWTHYADLAARDAAYRRDTARQAGQE